MDRGSFIIGGITTEDIVQAIDLSRDLTESGDVILPPRDYLDDKVSLKVVKIIQSHTKLVNKVVWNK